MEPLDFRLRVAAHLADEPGVAVPQLLDVRQPPREEGRLEYLVDGDAALAGGLAHVVGEVALVAAGVAHARLGDLQADLNVDNGNAIFLVTIVAV